MRRVLAVLLLIPTACGGCEDVACSHPLVLDVRFPAPSPDEPVSLVVEYDGEHRFASCPSLEAGCEVTCGNATCPDDDDDVVLSRTSGGLDLSIGHMTHEGDSSCRGAKDVVLDVSRGRASFETVTLALDYDRDDAYGGPGCGVADRREFRTVTLAP